MISRGWIPTSVLSPDEVLTFRYVLVGLALIGLASGDLKDLPAIAKSC